MSPRYFIIAFVLLAALAVVFGVFSKKPAPEIVRIDSTPSPTVQPSTAPTSKTIQAQDIKNADPAFTFTANIPTKWQVEAVPAIQALNVYDPIAAGTSNLEKSQIFIRFFKANDFLTLSTVNIYAEKDLKFNNRPAVEYDIEKKEGIAAFPNQPAWRSERHFVTDIRATDTSPFVFYVIAKRPELDQRVYKDFLQSLKIN